MRGAYGRVFAAPATKRLVAAGVVARIPVPVIPTGIVTMLSLLRTDENEYC